MITDIGRSHGTCYTFRMNSLWGNHICEEGRDYTASVGCLRLTVRRIRQGWLVASRHTTDSAFESLREVPAVPEQTEWMRFITPEAAPKLHLTPILPDRSVVSQSEAHIEIAPKHSGLFYVTIPVWVQVRAGEISPVTLCEFPSQILSKTWFGHPSEEGEICYALTTRARQELAELTDIQGRVICPLTLDNMTSEPLVFGQLLLSVRHMSVYQTQDGRLWTNECRMGFAGRSLPASVTFGRKVPAVAQQARWVSGPREAPASGLSARVIANAIFRQPF